MGTADSRSSEGVPSLPSSSSSTVSGTEIAPFCRENAKANIRERRRTWTGMSLWWLCMEHIWCKRASLLRSCRLLCKVFSVPSLGDTDCLLCSDVRLAFSCLPCITQERTQGEKAMVDWSRWRLIKCLQRHCTAVSVPVNCREKCGEQDKPNFNFLWRWMLSVKWLACLTLKPWHVI